MDILIPQKVRDFPFDTQDKYRWEDGKFAVIPDPSDARRIPVKDILISPQKRGKDRVVWERLVPPNPWLKPHKERDLPVVHIKCTDQYWTPSLEDSSFRVWTGSMVLKIGNTLLDPPIIKATGGVVPELYWSEGSELGFPSPMHVGMFRYAPSTDMYYMEAEYTYVYDSSDGHYFRKEVRMRSRAVPATQCVKAGELISIDFRSLPDSYWDAIVKPDQRVYWNYPRSRHAEFTVSDEDLVESVHTSMMRALQFDELTLYSESGKGHYLTQTRLRYPLRVALGAAFGRSMQPSETNPGLPTLGFNNLQNLAALIDGMALLGLGSQGAIPDVIGKLTNYKTANEACYDRLAKIGKQSRYRMTHDPDWLQLTPTQQRRLIRRSEISSATSTINSQLVIADRNNIPDYMDKPGWGTFSNAWFRGRYVWSTGWHDATQAYAYFQYKMQQALNTLEQYPILHGRSNIVSDYWDKKGESVPDAIVRVSYTARERVLEGLCKMTKFCYEMGLLPSAAVCYDFIPFSFVVDWFFPVQDALEVYDRNAYMGPLYYQYDNGFCCSVKYRTTASLGFGVQCYTRWYQSNPPEFELGHFVMTNEKHPSAKTTAFRFTDGICLLLRR